LEEEALPVAIPATIQHLVLLHQQVVATAAPGMEVAGLVAQVVVEDGMVMEDLEILQVHHHLKVLMVATPAAIVDTMVHLMEVVGGVLLVVVIAVILARVVMVAMAFK
jgi:hypothetical protein